jgi:hypothetical protein
MPLRLCLKSSQDAAYRMDSRQSDRFALSNLQPSSLRKEIHQLIALGNSAAAFTFFLS